MHILRYKIPDMMLKYDGYKANSFISAHLIVTQLRAAGPGSDVWPILCCSPDCVQWCEVSRYPALDTS